MRYNKGDSYVVMMVVIMLDIKFIVLLLRNFELLMWVIVGLGLLMIF